MLSTLDQWITHTKAHCPLLTPSEELLRAHEVRRWLDHPAGPDDCPPGLRRRGLRARNRMMTANIRLVVKVAVKWQYAAERSKGRIDVDDLIQEGMLGLNRAIEKFEPARGYKFSTYAYWWIRQSIGRYADLTVDAMTPGVNTLGDLRRVKATAEQLMQQGQQATPEALSAATGFGAKRVNRLLIFAEHRRTTSLDQTAKSEDGTPLVELIETPSAVEQQADEKEAAAAEGLVRQIRSVLDDREWDVLTSPVFKGERLKEIGARYGVSRSAISGQRVNMIPTLRELFADQRLVA